MNMIKNYNYKIAISGKAKSGKDTVSKLFKKSLLNIIYSKSNIYCYSKLFSFASPIKDMIKIMLPETKSKTLNGSSQLRATKIPMLKNKNDDEISYRDLLIHIGTIGRDYNENIWINNLDFKLKKFLNSKYNTIGIVTDVRFKNEFDYLKSKNFCMIRIKRSSSLIIKDVSETQQDEISDEKFDFIINNNGSKEDLLKEVEKISNLIKC